MGIVNEDWANFLTRAVGAQRNYAFVDFFDDKTVGVESFSEELCEDSLKEGIHRLFESLAHFGKAHGAVFGKG